MKDTLKFNKKLRLKLFFFMFFGYMLFYFTRKSLIFVSPLAISDMHISLNEFGTINTSFYIVYAISKFISGIISDRTNPKYILTIGLMFTGFLNVCIMLFSFSINLILFFWTLNAFFQGWGWPPITKYLSYFYNKNERGFWWGIYSLSHNIGGAIIPIIVGFLSIKFGWKSSIGIVGFISIIVSFFLIKLVINVPDIEHEKYTKNLFFKHVKNVLLVLSNINIWFLSFSYFFIYVIKTAVNDWTILFLINQKNYDLISAGVSIFYFEITGILGMICSGYITDKFLNGNRISYIFLSTLCLSILSLIFCIVPIGYKNFDYFVISLLGFFIFGPQMLIGLIASEFVNKNFACTANGFVGTWAYIGAAITGYPFSFAINLSWNIYFYVIVTSAVILTIITLIFILKDNLQYEKYFKS